MAALALWACASVRMVGYASYSSEGPWGPTASMSGHGAPKTDPRPVPAGCVRAADGTVVCPTSTYANGASTETTTTGSAGPPLATATGATASSRSRARPAAAVRPTPTEAAPVLRPLAGPFTRLPYRYNAPRTLPYRQPVKIQLAIETEGRGSSAESFEGLPGPVVAPAGALIVTETMTAKLTGPADQVLIKAIDDPVQRLSTTVNTTWGWNVTALTPGEATLELRVYGHFKEAGSEQVKQVLIKNVSIPVQVRPLEAAGLWIKQANPIYAFLATVIAALGGAITWWIKTFGRPQPSPAEPRPSGEPASPAPGPAPATAP